MHNVLHSSITTSTFSMLLKLRFAVSTTCGATSTDGKSKSGTSKSGKKNPESQNQDDDKIGNVKIQIKIKYISAAGLKLISKKKAGSRGGSPRKGGSGREFLPAGSKGRSP